MIPQAGLALPCGYHPQPSSGPHSCLSHQVCDFRMKWSVRQRKSQNFPFLAFYSLVTSSTAFALVPAVPIRGLPSPPVDQWYFLEFLGWCLSFSIPSSVLLSDTAMCKRRCDQPWLLQAFALCVQGLSLTWNVRLESLAWGARPFVTWLISHPSPFVIDLALRLLDSNLLASLHHTCPFSFLYHSLPFSRFNLIVC